MIVFGTTCIGLETIGQRADWGSSDFGKDARTAKESRVVADFPES
jgi:hypothetical protein